MPKQANSPNVNLPLELTSFIGRERERIETRRLLAKNHLLTLTGAGGCGKTRLALRVATDLANDFADGVHWADLGMLNDAALVPESIAKTLNLVEQVGNAPTEALVDFLCDKEMLLVLDNCEHLLTACAELVQNILRDAADVRIIATSREPLAVTGETLYPVSPLAVPPPNQFTNVEQFDAIRLFVERAHQVLPSFMLTTDNASIVAEICRRLDGIPLAIELASSRVKVLSIQQIAARLDDRFALLATAPHNTPSHHQTLRAAIDWSYELLTSTEQVLLRRLSVFAGGCSLVAAEAVCTGDRVGSAQLLDLLSSLVNKSLLQAQTLQPGAARYSFLETIREYAHERLMASPNGTPTRDRHLKYVLWLIEDTAPKLVGRDQLKWLNVLESERDNIRVALTWSLESGAIEAGLRIAYALVEYWQKRGSVQEGLDWMARLFEHADERVPQVVRVHALAHAAYLAMLLGHSASTTEYGRAASNLGEVIEGDDTANLAVTLTGLAQSLRAAGDYETALKVGDQSIQLLRKTNDPYLLGRVLIMQAGSAMALERFEVVHLFLDESMKLAQDAGDRYRIALILNFLGDLARCEQDYVGAKTIYESSYAIFRELDTKRDLASALQNLGHACLHLGDEERAHALFTESLALQQSHDNAPGMAECLIGFAAIAILRHMPGPGVRLLSAAVVLGGPRPANVWTATRKEYERYLALARDQLTQSEFQTEQAAGSAFSLEQAIEYALHLPQEASNPSPRIPDALTPREREIAVKIAQGKSNGEIAEELLLSKRTVEKHIANILSKLSIPSRTHIVRWVLQNGPGAVSERQDP